MARCPAHGHRIQQTPSEAVNLFGATPQPDCRRTDSAAVDLADPLAGQLLELAEMSTRGIEAE